MNSSVDTHRQFLAIVPLEMVHAVSAGATAPFDLQEEVGSLAHDILFSFPQRFGN